MIYLYGIFLFVFGTIIGSFTNAQVDRYRSSRIMAKRSKCFQCGQVLGWRQLIPLYSYLIQQGKCSSCYGQIPIKLFMSEFATGVLFSAVLIKYPNLFNNFDIYSLINLLSYLVIISLMMAIVLTDLKDFTIPHQLSLSLIFISLLLLFFNSFIANNFNLAIPNLMDLWAGPILAGFFWFIWLITGGQGMGFADGTLALSIGWLLGLWPGISAVLYAFWVGTIISVSILLWQKYMPRHKSKNLPTNHHQTLTMKSAIPFGPYLVMGFCLVFIFNVTLPLYW